MIRCHDYCYGQPRYAATRALLRNAATYVVTRRHYFGFVDAVPTSLSSRAVPAQRDAPVAPCVDAAFMEERRDLRARRS